MQSSEYSDKMLLLALLLAVDSAIAGPVTIGTSSTAMVAGGNAYTLNPLVIVVPLVGFALLLLVLSVCCCICRGRNSQSRPASRPTHWRYSNPMRPLPPRADVSEYAHLSSVAYSEPPPAYSPVLSAPSSRPRGTNGSHASKYLRLAGNPWEDNHTSAEDLNGGLLNPPSPLVARTGSPSLQIWTPPVSPTPPPSRFWR